MTESRSKRLQVHLSTAVVMMFVAGALIWANVRARKVETIGRYFMQNPTPLLPTPESDAQDKATRELNPGITIGPRFTGEMVDGSEAAFWRDANNDNWYGNRDFHYGWPCDVMYSSTSVMVFRSGHVHTENLSAIDDFVNLRPTPIKDWNSSAIVINAAVALGFLFAVWFVCEWWIRRRASIS